VEYPILIILAVLGIGTVLAVLPVALTTLAEHREPKSLLCPETALPAAVQVDAGRATRGALFGRMRLAVQSCSRWPERRGCAQGCLSPLVGATLPPDTSIVGGPAASG